MITPPTSGATVVAMPIVMPQIAQARARARGSGKAWAITASAAVSSIAAPIPLAARARLRNSTEGASPQASEAAAKASRPSSIMRLRP